MKKIAIAIWLSMVATLAYANCTTQTFMINGKMTFCQVCCYNGNCTTTCY